MLLRFPDPEYAEAFRAYVNYFEDLAGSIGGLYGMAPSLAAGVHDGVADHPPTWRVQRRPLNRDRAQGLDTAFRKSWSTLRRLDREVEDPDLFDEEANAWLPSQAYYAIYHAILGFAAASRQAIPRDHAAALKLAGKEVVRGSLPTPWDAWCEGCPQTGSHQFGGVIPSGEAVHVLSSPDPWSSDDRLAMFLRTTRRKELERRFAVERNRKPKPGRTRRNLSASDKERIAGTMAPTTLFDVLWRMRKKAHYEDADTFVLGAAGELDARRFGQALVIVTDATVAVLEGITAAYIGPDLLADLAEAYVTKISADADSAVGRRATSWDERRRSTTGS
ncbi:MAG: hypothetical protein GY798_14900 [Hyphomicrobiales bacterium]|nr:hypothetical protein [Hyphomicrobiales bacterium]